jgi:hypothetical protein
VSGRDAEGDGQTGLVPVALIVSPGDRVPSGPYFRVRSAERYAALLDRIDAAWSRDRRVSGDQAMEVVA